jgi:hypothetical protein
MLTLLNAVRRENGRQVAQHDLISASLDLL